MSLPRLLGALLPQVPDFVDEEAGVRSKLVGAEIETPVELVVERARRGVDLGITPPLYHVVTSELPVLHTIRIVAVVQRNEP